MTSVSSFYDELAADYHLNYADWNNAVRRQGRTLAQLIAANGAAGARTVLDCSCGIGTQAIGLALEEYAVTATDISPASIERARHEAGNFGVEIPFSVADFRDLSSVETTFDAVISCDNSLTHVLTDDDILTALRSMRDRLNPGGLLVIGIRDYDEITRQRPRSTSPQVIDRETGRSILFQVWDWFEDGRGYDFTLFVVKAEGEGWATTAKTTRYRALLRDELDALLLEAGFVDPEWHFWEETGHHQPLVTARRA
ncbi:MAG TPA: class I SAM-dependent methyltransferase [Thermomicrobiales bacterium]|nr:class I SAM-dependent methyltransferase [Thermomicrobiales bacterium]